MPQILIDNIQPPFGNQLAPCAKLIQELYCRDKVLRSVEKIDLVRPLSGGLSGAVVASVSAGSTAIVVKIDQFDRINSEYDRFKKHLKNKFTDFNPKMGTFAAKVIFPNEKEENLIKELGFDGNYYSIIAYTHGGTSPNGISGIKTFDEICKKFLFMDGENALNGLTKCTKLLDKLGDLLFTHFYSIDETQEVSIRYHDIPKFPWETFIPMASLLSTMVPGWTDFVYGLPEAWMNSGNDITKYKPVTSHGDLRCANILVSESDDSLSPFIVDYGLTGPGHPLSDFARLEADLLIRVGLTAQNHRELLNAVLESVELVPSSWANNENIFLRVLFGLRKCVKQLVPFNAREGDAANVYRYFLVGHGARLARLYDPSIDALSLERKKDYIWLILSLMNRLMTRNISPEKRNLVFPLQTDTLKDIQQCGACDKNPSGLKDLFWGGNRRNELKRELILNHDGPIRLLAHTGNSYLNDIIPRGHNEPEGRFYAYLKERLLNKNLDVNIRIVLLNPLSVEGSKLSIAESRGDLLGPELSLDFLCQTEVFKRFETCIESYKQLAKQFPNIDLRISHYSPDATLLISDKVAFIEPYLVGQLVLRYYDSLKMNMPELLVEKGNTLYKAACEQFDFMWKRAIEVIEYAARKDEFVKSFMNFERLRRKVVSLHESWYAVDPVVGCPNYCDYCFLTPFHINKKDPYIFRTANDGYIRLKENRFFKGQNYLMDSILDGDERLPIPVACGNYTEMFDNNRPFKIESDVGYISRTTNNLEILEDIVRHHSQLESIMKRLPILCLITKRQIQQPFIDFLIRQLTDFPGLNIAIFTSISFLPEGIEDLNMEYASHSIMNNFKLCNEINNAVKGSEGKYRRIVGIHFWRPLIPGLNSEDMFNNLNSIKNYGATSSVAVGLKLSKRLRDYIRLKGGLGGSRGEGNAIYKFKLPNESSEYFDNRLKKKAVETGSCIQHPVFLHTSCAISHAFGRPDYNATFKNCKTPNQRILKKVMDICSLTENRYKVNKSKNDTKNSIEILGIVDQEIQTFIRQMLGVEIKSDIELEHEWKGSASKINSGSVCEESCCPDDQRNICEVFYNNR